MARRDMGSFLSRSRPAARVERNLRYSRFEDNLRCLQTIISFMSIVVDRLQSMSILLRAADLGSFTAASKALRIPLPTVSRRIAELEAHLGARLLHRTTRSLSLTEAGVAY